MRRLKAVPAQAKPLKPDKKQTGKYLLATLSSWEDILKRLKFQI